MRYIYPFFDTIIRRICIGVILISISYGVQAEGCDTTCDIQNAPATPLVEYLANVNKVMSKVRSENSAQATKNDNYFFTLKSSRKNLIGSFNALFNWNTYYGEFDYYFTLPITQSIPPQVKRDVKMLEKHIESLTKQLEIIVKRGNHTKKITNVCVGLEDFNCAGLEGHTGEEIVISLIRNSENILNFIRLSLQGKQAEVVEPFIMVKNNFAVDILRFYNSYTLKDCSSCKGNFNESVGTKISNIINFNTLGEKGIQRWKDAANLLYEALSGGGTSAKYRDIERKVLARELSRQGLGGGQAQIILNNLARYNNEGGYSISNNFVSNTFAPVGEQLGKIGNDFKNALGVAYNRYGGQSIPIMEVVNIQEEIKKSALVQREIGAFYTSHKPIAAAKDLEADTLLDRLVTYHVNLIQILAELQKVIPKAIEACDSQAYKKEEEAGGNCDPRKL